jgi:hypothetical protein
MLVGTWLLWTWRRKDIQEGFHGETGFRPCSVNTAILLINFKAKKEEKKERKEEKRIIPNIFLLVLCLPLLLFS